MAVKVICVILLELLCATSMVVCQIQGDSDFHQNDIIRFLIEPDDLIVAKGKSAILHCVAQSMLLTEEVSISWLFNDSPLNLDKDKRKYVHQNGSLVFTKVVGRRQQNTVSDEGVYRCLAKSAGVALVSRPAELKVAYLSKDISLSWSNISVDEGDTVRLECNFDSVPTAEVSWLFQNKTLAFGTTNSRYIVIAPDVLYITSAQQTDSGEYRCVANNTVTKKSRRSSNLCRLLVNAKNATLSKLEFMSPLLSKAVTVRESETLILECAVIGPANIINVFWIYAADESGRKNLLSNATRGVNIYKKSNVAISDSGIYTCIASIRNSNNDNPISQTVKVDVTTLPVITKKTENKILPVALSVRFECEAFGYPMPKISWLHNGVPIKRGSRIKQTETELLLKNTVSDDSGVYQCIASNKYGSVSASSHLHVIGSLYQPPPPMGLRCTSLNSTEILVSWELSPHDSAEQPPIIIKSQDPDAMDNPDMYQERVSIQPMIRKAYSVHCFPTDGSGVEVQELAVNRSFILNRLKPHTNYTIYVRTYNGKSSSDQSDYVTCRTGGQDRAIRISLNVVGPTMIFLQWFIDNKNKEVKDSLEEYGQDVNSVLYKVQWKRTRLLLSDLDEVDTNSTSYTMFGLQPNTQYEIRVLGISEDNDVIAESEWMSVVTHSESSALFPVLRLNTLNATNLQVTWIVDEKFKVASVKLYYNKLNNDEDKITPVHVPDEQKYYVLSNLEPGIRYNVTLEVTMTNNAKGFAWKTVQMPIVFKSKTVRSYLLPPPSNLHAEARSPNSIFITWTIPKNTKATFYTVYCFDVENTSQPSMPYTLTSINNAILISDLHANVLYEIKIISCGSNNTYSDFSEKVYVRTLNYVSEVIDNVSWLSLNLSSIYISWRFSRSVSSFLVCYTRYRNDPFHLWTMMPNVGNATSVVISNLQENTKYYVMIQAKLDAINYTAPLITDFLLNTNKLVDSSTLNTLTASYSGITEEQWLGLYIGVAISLCCIFFCIGFVIFCRKRYEKHLKELEKQRERRFSPDNHELSRTTFYDKKLYSNGCVNNNSTAIQIPLLPSSSSSVAPPNVRVNDNSRHSDIGKDESGEEMNNLLSSDSIGAEDLATHGLSIETSGPDKDDKEGGDSGYCDRRNSQSPQLKDYINRRSRKSSDVTIDDGFYENEVHLIRAN